MLRKYALKWMRLGIVWVACLLSVSFAMAEAAPEEAPLSLPAPFTGHFTQERFIRVAPRTNTDPVIRVPKDTSLYLMPVNADYAETSYDGLTGYIYYPDAVRDPAEITPVTPYVAYSRKPLRAYGAPHYSAESTTGFPAYTPFEVNAEIGAFVMITQENSQKWYIPSSALLTLKADKDASPYPAYLRAASVLYRFPLAGSPAGKVLPMSSEVMVTAENGDYAYVRVGTDRGYVLLDSLAALPRQRATSSFAYALQPAVLYSAPSAHACTDDYVKAGVVLEIDGVAGSFSHVKNLDAFVPTDSLKKLEVAVLKTPLIAYWETEQLLYRNTATSKALLDIKLAPNVPVHIRWSLGAYYLIPLDHQWGMVPKAGAVTIKSTSYKTPSFFVAHEGTAYYTNPIPGAVAAGKLEADVFLKVAESLNSFAKIRQEEPFQYVALADLERIQDVVKVASYEVYFESETQLVDVPHPAGKPAARISGNRLVRVSLQNDDYAYISTDEAEGYVRLDQAEKLPDLFSNKETLPKYYLFLNKSTRELTVYHADEEGRRTDSIVRQVIVAIGKRTTPTPSGIFPLGGRERWHYFGPSFAPFAIKFISGRYLHGPLYYSTNEKSVMTSLLEEFGSMATGGCIRIPYDDMLWIYTHCMKDNAVLEIVNGV